MPTPFSEIIGNGQRPKYTLIDDVTESASGYSNYNLDNTLGTDYNSDDIILGMGKSKPSTRTTPQYPPSYLRNNQSNWSPNMNLSNGAFNNLNVPMLEEESRKSPAISNVYDMNSKMAPVNQYVTGNGIAGTQPMLKDAAPKSREGFSHMFRGRQITCMELLHHMKSCPMCARYYSSDSRIYHVIIFMLILLFVVILYFVTKEEKK